MVKLNIVNYMYMDDAFIGRWAYLGALVYTYGFEKFSVLMLNSVKCCHQLCIPLTNSKISNQAIEFAPD